MDVLLGKFNAVYQGERLVSLTTSIWLLQEHRTSMNLQASGNVSTNSGTQETVAQCVQERHYAKIKESVPVASLLTIVWIAEINDAGGDCVEFDGFRLFCLRQLIRFLSSTAETH